MGTWHCAQLGDTITYHPNGSYTLQSATLGFVTGRYAVQPGNTYALSYPGGVLLFQVLLVQPNGSIVIRNSWGQVLTYQRTAVRSALPPAGGATMNAMPPNAGVPTGPLPGGGGEPGTNNKWYKAGQAIGKIFKCVVGLAESINEEQQQQQQQGWGGGGYGDGYGGERYYGGY